MYLLAFYNNNNIEWQKVHRFEPCRLRWFREEVRKIDLKKQMYHEYELVKKLCTEAQIKSYEKNYKFSGGKQRSIFLDKLSAYCEYEHDRQNRTYTITELYDIPMTMAQARLHKGIYQFLAPLILNEMLNNHDENNKARMTIFDLARQVALINPNYDYVKFNMELSSDELDIPYLDINEFFKRADVKIDEYLRRCLKYLRSENCVLVNEVHVIQTFEEKVDISDGVAVITKVKDLHTASDDEMNLYSRLVEEASNISGAHTNQEQWYGKNAQKFKRVLEESLRNNGIDYVCRAFEMWYVDLNKCEKMLAEYTQEFSIEEHADMLGKVFKLMIDENAENRLGKKSYFDTDYVEHFKTLSSLTILPDAEDLRGKFKGWKSKSEKMIEKAQDTVLKFNEVHIER